MEWSKKRNLLYLIILIIIIFIGVFFGTNISDNLLGKEIVYLEVVNFETNVKTLTVDNIVIESPNNVKCKWNNPDENFLWCENILEITNNDLVHDFIEKDIPLADFKHIVNDLKVYTSKTYNTWEDRILNETCFDSLDDETQSECVDNISVCSECYYNYTRRIFSDWKLKTKVDKYPKGATIGVKLVFKSPMMIENGNYVNNQFNFSIFSDSEVITLDPDVTTCVDISSSGTYTMTGDITDETTSYCINISSANVVFDCDGHTVDGNNAADYGFSVYGETYDNVTIKNCVVTDWDTYTIRAGYGDDITIDNVNISGGPDTGIYFATGSDNVIINNSNITAGTVSNDYGIYWGNGNLGITIENTNVYGGDGLRMLEGWVTALNSIFTGNHYDVYVLLDSFECSNVFTNVNGTDNKPIVFHNSSVTIDGWNNNVSTLILCGADNSVINNLNLTTSDARTFNILHTDNSNFTNINIKDYFYGMYLTGSDYNIFSDININSSSHTGIYVYDSDHNVFSNIALSSGSNDGIYMSSASRGNTLKDSLIQFQSGANDIGIYLAGDDNIMFNNTIKSNYYGISLQAGADDNNISFNTITGNTYGLYEDSSAANTPNIIYNNIFNQTNNLKFDLVNNGINYWNTTNANGTRIYGNGTNIAGNVWLNGSSSASYYADCTDSNADGFCDNPLNLTSMTACSVGVDCDVKTTDYKPLSNKYSLTKTPVLVLNNTYPDSPTIDDDLKFNITCTDSDVGDTITGYLEVFNGSISFKNYSVVVSNNTETLLWTVGSGNTSEGEIWNGSYWCGDSTTNSSKDYDNVTIPANNVPTTPTTLTGNNSLDLNITWTNESLTLNCSGSTDNENDTITYVLEKGNRTTNSEFCNGTATACANHADEASCDYDNGCNWSGGGSANYTTKYCGNNCSGGDYTYPSTPSCTNHILADACGGASSCDGTDSVVDIWLNGTTFLSTDTIGVTIQVMCFGTGDEVKIWYYNGSTWTEEFYDSTCNYAAATGNYTDTISITSSSTTQYIRAQVTYGTLSGDDECYTGTYGDNDDISFTVVGTSCSGTPDSCGTYNSSETNCSRVSCDWNNESISTSWSDIGNHTNGTTYSWNVSLINDTTDWDLRCKSIDLNGSNTYSSYYTKGCYLNISITSEAPPAAGDNCSCPGVGVSKTYNLSLHCNITSPCTLDTMSFKDSGWINISAIINTSNFNLTGLMGQGYLMIDEGSGRIIRRT